ncbi:TIGR02147 family protein [Bdellovibrionota bacterium FG-2]
MIALYDFNDYRLYLRRTLDESIPARGARSRLAAHLGCQTAFISQVLAEKVHLSLEYAVRVGPFFGLSEYESNFFVLLVHFRRAGSKALRDYYQTQISQILEKRSRVEERIEVRNKLSFEDQAHYYDTWYYGAIHVALSLSKKQTPAVLASLLKLPLGVVQEVLEQLTASGLARRIGGEFGIGEKRIHLNKESPFIRKHHTNWRMKAIAALDLPGKTDLHYSGALALSETDFVRVREMLIETLAKAEPILRDSKEEMVAAISLDWFKL